MATQIELSTITNISEYPNSFKRQTAFPLDRYSLFDSLSSAEEYALSNGIAYAGQIITVVDNETSAVTTHKILTDGTLGQIDSTLSVSGSDYVSVTETSAGVQVSLNDLFLDGGNASGALS